MRRFPWLEAHGAAVAFITDSADGDCGWEGCASGSRQRFMDDAPIPGDKLVVLRQCHGNRIFRVESVDAGRGAESRETALGDGDALMTGHAGIPLGINVADCVPLFLCGPGVVSVVHAGRAGTEQGIAALTVEALRTTYETDPSSLFALIGPSAGPCCYQVGPEVLASAVNRGVVADGDCLDLWESNRQQLIGAGVPAAHIALDGWCTICQPGYFSFRSDGSPRRNLAVIMR